MTPYLSRLAAAAALSVTLLAGCGGGGGGDSSSTPAPVSAGDTPFALATGYQARIVSGATDSFTLSAPSSCTGTATIATQAAVVNTFEGIPGFKSPQVSTANFTNCAPATSTATGATYYNATYVPVGLSIDGGEYSVLSGSATTWPNSAKVGDTGVLSTLTTYQDSTKALTTGSREVSYLIEADTSTTAIANVITKSFDQNHNLLATQQSRYRMSPNGTLTLVSIDVQFSFTSTVHLIYTPT